MGGDRRRRARVRRSRNASRLNLKSFFQTDDDEARDVRCEVKYSPLARLCVCFLACTAVPNDARGMVQTNSVEFPFSVRGGRREQEAASENVLTPYVENGKYFKCVYDANANANTRSMTSGRLGLARAFFRRVVVASLDATTTTLTRVRRRLFFSLARAASPCGNNSSIGWASSTPSWR